MDTHETLPQALPIIAPAVLTPDEEIDMRIAKAGIDQAIVDGMYKLAEQHSHPITSAKQYTEAKRALNDLAKVRLKGEKVIDAVHSQIVAIWKRSNAAKHEKLSWINGPESIILPHTKAWEAEQARLAKEEEERVQALKEQRKTILTELGYTFVPGPPEHRYVLEGVTIPLRDVIDCDHETWSNKILTYRMHSEEVADRRKQAEEARLAEQQRLEAERKALEEREAKLKAMVQTIRNARIKTLMEAGWAQGKEDMQLYGTDNNDVPVQVCPIDMLADYDDAEIAVLVKAGNEQREKRKAVEAELLALKQEAEEREALNEKHKNILIKCGYVLSPRGDELILIGERNIAINQIHIPELWTLDTVRLTQLVTDGNCELDRRKQAEEERIRQQERERLEAERVAAEKREAERVAALGDVDKWNEWIEAIKASAPTMTSAIGKQAVDRATKYLNDLSPGVIRDLKQD